MTHTRIVVDYLSSPGRLSAARTPRSSSARRRTKRPRPSATRRSRPGSRGRRSGREPEAKGELVYEHLYAPREREPIGALGGCHCVGPTPGDRSGVVFPGLQPFILGAERPVAIVHHHGCVIALEVEGDTIGLRFVPSLLCGRAQWTRVAHDDDRFARVAHRELGRSRRDLRAREASRLQRRRDTACAL